MKYLFGCMLLLTAASANACDVCGGMSGSSSQGILPQYNRHFIGIQYKYAGFNTAHSVSEGYATAFTSKQYYHTTQLTGRYYINRYMQLMAFVPYHFNSNIEGNLLTRYSGIGDVSLWANTTIIKTPDTSDGLLHTLYAGAGVKAPTGKHISNAISLANEIPELQTGTGAWDIVLNTNYTVRKNNFGINLAASYTITSTSPLDNYKYGNKFSASLAGLYRINTGSFSFLPMAGMSYDISMHDRTDAKKTINVNTGGQLLYALMGVQAYYKGIGIQLYYLLPAAQHYGGGEITAKGKADAGVFFLF